MLSRPVDPVVTNSISSSSSSSSAGRDERRLGKLRCCYEIKQTLEHQHLVCRGCGKIIEFESPLIRKLVDKIQRNHRFNVTKAELYLEGYCEQCKEKTVPTDS